VRNKIESEKHQEQEQQISSRVKTASSRAKSNFKSTSKFKSKKQDRYHEINFTVSNQCGGSKKKVQNTSNKQPVKTATWIVRNKQVQE